MANTIKIDVLADVRDINKGIKDVNGKLDGFNTKLGKVGSALKGAFVAGAAAVVGAGLVSGIKGAITAASDMNETVSKTQTIFGKASPDIIAFGENAAKSMGISKQEALAGASAFGNFFDQIGLSKKASADMSKGLVTMASDLASFNNADPAKVMEALQGATRGEYDSLQQFIPTVNAAAVQTEALAETHKKSAKTLTDAEKATALYTLAQKGMGKAQGDFARTSGGLANQQRILSARFKDLQATLGAKLLPIALKVVTFFGNKLGPVMDKAGGIVSTLGNVFSTKVLPKIKQFGDYAGQNLLPIAKNIVAAFRPLATNIGNALVAAFNALVPKVKEFGGFLSGTVVPAVQKFSQFMRDNSSAIGAIVVGLTAALAVFKAYQATLAIISGVTKAYTAVQAALNVVMSLNPIGLVILAITALVAAFLYLWKTNDGFRNALIGAWNAVKNAVLTAVNAVVGFVKKNWPLLLSIITGPLGAIVILVVRNWDTIKKTVSAGVSAVINFFKKLPGQVVTAVGNLAKLLVRKGADLINGLASGYNKAIGAVASFFRSIAGKVVGWIGNAAGTLARKGRDFVQGLANGAAGNIKAFTNFINGLPGRALSALGSVGSTLYSAGKNLLQGMINGVKSMASSLINSVTGPISDAIGKAKGLLGIHSPSRVFQEIGLQTIAGLEIGLSKTAGVKQAASGLAAAVANGFNAPELAIDGAGSGGTGGEVHLHLEGSTFIGVNEAEFTRMVQNALAKGQKFVKPTVVMHR